MYSFEGSYNLEVHGKKVPINLENLLMRGCALKNTNYIIGIVIYTGHETKIMKNS